MLTTYFGALSLAKMPCVQGIQQPILWHVVILLQQLKLQPLRMRKQVNGI